MGEVLFLRGRLLVCFQKARPALTARVGYIARKTREAIVRRTAAGRERARANGVRFGRPPKLSLAQRVGVLARCNADEDLIMLALEFKVSTWTIHRVR
jgi:DNA invertase Pin-like site-specific DNA recombinase